MVVLSTVARDVQPVDPSSSRTLTVWQRLLILRSRASNQCSVCLCVCVRTITFRRNKLTLVHCFAAWSLHCLRQAWRWRSEIRIHLNRENVAKVGATSSEGFFSTILSKKTTLTDINQQHRAYKYKDLPCLNKTVVLVRWAGI